MAEHGEYLSGGSGGVWRTRGSGGDFQVHRPVGPWTPAVHALLAHLETKGLRGVPRVLGFDDRGREVLTYLSGSSPVAGEVPSVELLIEAATWLREFHEAVADFRPMDIVWRQGNRGIAAGQIICHNDTGLYNWVIDGEPGEPQHFVGMIDWDRAGPGRPIDDLAFLCWTGVPLDRLEELASLAPDDSERVVHELARRLNTVAVAYGGIGAETLLDAVGDRMRLTVQRWEEGLALGDPGTIALRDAGIMDRHLAKLRHFERETSTLMRAL